MAYSLDTTDLAAYPGVKIPSAQTGELVVRLVNGKINGAFAAIGRSADEVVEQAEITGIALEVAARALRNPTGATSITTGLDDWKQTLRYEGEAAAARKAGVYLEPGERSDLLGLLDPAGAAVSSPVRSIRLSVPGVYSCRP